MPRLNNIGYFSLAVLIIAVATSLMYFLPLGLRSVQLWLLICLLILPVNWRLSIITAIIMGWAADIFTPSSFGLHLIAYPSAVGLTALSMQSWHTTRPWLKFIGVVSLGSTLAWVFASILEIIFNLFGSREIFSGINLAYLGWAITSVFTHSVLTLMLMPILRKQLKGSGPAIKL